MRAGLRLLTFTAFSLMLSAPVKAQINTDRMMSVGRTALYFDDYVLSIQYFNQVINAKPYLYEPYFYRAVAKLSLEDYRGAEQDCSSSISRNPFVVNSYQVRGLALVYQNRFEEAIADFRRGLKLDPENHSLRHNLILCLAKLDMTDEALAAADTLLEQSSKYTPAMAMRSDILWEKGDTVGALEWVNKAVETDKYDTDLLHHRGVLLARMERYADAEPDLDRAIYLNPGEAGSYITRAMIRYCQDNLKGALADYDMAILIDPVNVNAHYNRGNLRAQIGDDNRAIEDFDIVIEAEPDNMMALFYRGLLRYNTGDYRGAEQDITKVLDEYPQFVQGYQIRSDVREKLGNRRGAEQDAMVVLREQNRRFNNAMGYSDEPDPADDGKTRERSDKNVRNYRKIVVDENLENATGFTSEYRGKVQNRNVEVQYLEPYRLTYYRNTESNSRHVLSSDLLETLNRTGRFMLDILLENREVALDEDRISTLFSDIDRCTSKLADNPDDALLLMARALDFCLLQDYTSAESDLDAAIAADPALWGAWFCRAQVRIRDVEMKQANQELDLKQALAETKSAISDPGYQSAIRDLTRVLELEPSFAGAWYNRGTLYAITNDFHAALTDFDRAIELDADMAEAWYNRGLILVLLNRMDEAFSDLSKAGELGIYSAYNIIKRFSKSE
ncbi:MAG: tetratricopeptide repeat protein [Bacteroidaceae bacterium]|nr:tetratricopeptide repeat protein [Bacteroidaceae bacterium]